MDGQLPSTEPYIFHLFTPHCMGGNVMSIIKVSARSRTASVAGAVAGVIREVGRVEVQAIGAGAVNQAIKAIIIAGGYLAEENIQLTCVPSFVDIAIDAQERTAIRFAVEKQ